MKKSIIDNENKSLLRMRCVDRAKCTQHMSPVHSGESGHNRGAVEAVHAAILQQMRAILATAVIVGKRSVGVT